MTRDDVRKISWLVIAEAFGLDVTTNATMIFQAPTYTVAGVPSAASYPRGLIYVSNEVGGAVLAFSDSVNWRRVTDRAIVA